MDHSDFKSKLKQLVRTTGPEHNVRSKRYLIANDSGLEDYVVSLCYSYLRETAAKRREIEESMHDDDILWYVQRFIDNNTLAIQRPSDVESMLLGVVAIAIVGPHSDPRDVTFWLGELYLAAYIASVSERKSICERVGHIASDKCDLSEQIRLFPARNEQVVQREAELKKSGILTQALGIDDGSGLTPMMRAALSGNLPRLFELIHQGDDVNAAIDGASALAFAAFAGQEEAVELLINSGARIDVKPHGMSLLKFADLGGTNPKMSDRLKRAGARS